MITHPSLPRRVLAGVGVTAVLAMVAVTAGCTTEEEEAPETTTTTTTTTPPPATPTEKAPRINPDDPNPFSPTVNAPPAEGPTPGRHRGPRGQG